MHYSILKDLKHIHCDCGICNFVVFQKVKYLWVLLSFSWKLCERTKAKQQRRPTPSMICSHRRRKSREGRLHHEQHRAVDAALCF